MKAFAWALIVVGFSMWMYGQCAKAHAGPAYCYSTGQWMPWPGISGYCPDGEAPFNGPGPSYGGGNHRSPDGSDD